MNWKLLLQFSNGCVCVGVSRLRAAFVTAKYEDFRRVRLVQCDVDVCCISECVITRR